MKVHTATLALFLPGLSAQAGSPTADLFARMKRVQTTATQQGVIVSTNVTNVTHDKTGFSYRQVTFTKAPAGTYKMEADYRIEYSTLAGTSPRLEETGLGIVKFVVDARDGQKPFAVIVREYSTGAYAKDTNQGEPTKGSEPYFGFTFSTKSEAEGFKQLWTLFLAALKQ